MPPEASEDDEDALDTLLENHVDFTPQNDFEHRVFTLHSRRVRWIAIRVALLSLRDTTARAEDPSSDINVLLEQVQVRLLCGDVEQEEADRRREVLHRRAAEETKQRLSEERAVENSRQERAEKKRKESKDKRQVAAALAAEYSIHAAANTKREADAKIAEIALRRSRERDAKALAKRVDLASTHRRFAPPDPKLESALDKFRKAKALATKRAPVVLPLRPPERHRHQAHLPKIEKAKATTARTAPSSFRIPKKAPTSPPLTSSSPKEQVLLATQTTSTTFSWTTRSDHRDPNRCDRGGPSQDWNRGWDRARRRPYPRDRPAWGHGWDQGSRFSYPGRPSASSGCTAAETTAQPKEDTTATDTLKQLLSLFRS